MRKLTKNFILIFMVLILPFFLFFACTAQISDFHFVSIDANLTFNDSLELIYIINENYNQKAIIVYEINDGDEVLSFSKNEVLLHIECLVSDPYVKIYSNEIEKVVLVTAWLKEDVRVSSTMEISVYEKPISGMRIESEEDFVYNGESIQLEAIVFPANLVDDIRWSIDANNTIATISQDGVLHANVGALTDIEYNTSKGHKIAVTAKAYKADVLKFTTSRNYILKNKDVVKVEVDASTTELVTGDTLQLGVVVSPLASYQKVIWTTSNNTIASVNQTGLVTTNNKGTVTIRATSFTDNAIYDEVELNITPFYPVSIRFSSAVANTQTVGTSRNIAINTQIEFVDSTGKFINITKFSTNESGKYVLDDGSVIELYLVSSDLTVATIGTPTATNLPVISNLQKSGSFILSVHVKDHLEIESVELEVTITGDKLVTQILNIFSTTGVNCSSSVNNKEQVVVFDEVNNLDLPITLTAITFPVSVLPEYRDVEWVSSNEAIVKINENGELEFIGTGSAEIKAIAKFASTTVTRAFIIVVKDEIVKIPNITSFGSSYLPWWGSIGVAASTYAIALNSTVRIQKDIADLLVTPIYLYANSLNNLFVKVTYESSNDDVVEVNSETGELIFKDVGTALITGSVVNYDGTTAPTGKFTIEVLE